MFRGNNKLKLEELVKFLGLDAEKDSEKITKLTEEFNAKEKELNTANRNIAKLNKEIENSQNIAEKYEIVAKAFNLKTDAEDFDKMLDDVKDSFAKDVKGTEDFKEVGRELAKTKREYDKLKKDYDTINSELAVERENRVTSVKQSAILKELQANNVIKADQWVNRFFSEVNLEDDGKIYMKDAAGNEMSLQDGIAEWAKTNPEFVKAEIKGGVGSRGGSDTGGEVSDFMKDIIGHESGAESQKSLGELFG